MRDICTYPVRRAAALFPILATGLWLFATAAAAQASKAHVHGEGTMLVAVQDGGVEVELSLPGADVVGFEHAPKSAEDEKKVDEALAILAVPEKVFRFDRGAVCVMEDLEVVESLDHGDHGDEHGEFRLRYLLNCEAPDRLGTLELLIFDQFPGVREIDVQIVGPEGQSAFHLDRNKRKAEF